MGAYGTFKLHEKRRGKNRISNVYVVETHCTLNKTKKNRKLVPVAALLALTITDLVVQLGNLRE